VRARVAVAVLLSLAACTGPRGARVRAPFEDPDAGRPPTRADRQRGRGAAPGDERGPGGFVPRREAKSFYSAGGGRLWYYLNTYYWAPEGLATDEVWIHAEVVERFAGLRHWADGTPAPVAEPKRPAPKRTIEFWRVGRTGRAITLDNHKDFCLLDDDLCTGAIEVTVTLTLGALRVRGAEGAWGPGRQPYLLAFRDYGDGRGIGVENARFTPLEGEPTTVWAYRVPWSSLPGRMTRSTWEELRVPTWVLVERRPSRRPTEDGVGPTAPGATAPVTTTDD
jgi:hypothetical protein